MSYNKLENELVLGNNRGCGYWSCFGLYGRNGKRSGGFEMDPIVGVRHSEVILTVTESKTNLVMIEKLPWGRDSVMLMHGKWINRERN